MPEKRSSNWSSIRPHFDEWSKPALIALLKDIHDALPDARDFLLARVQAEEGGGAALEKYRRKIVEQFFPARGFGKIKLADARKAIRDYRKASGNLMGTIDLMLTYVENGTEFTRQFGDINASFYDSLASILSEMVQLLLREGPELYPRFRQRVQRLTTHASRIGWGYGDELREQVYRLEIELAGD
jgi:hypothetical protein